MAGQPLKKDMRYGILSIRGGQYHIREKILLKFNQAEFNGFDPRLQPPENNPPHLALGPVEFPGRVLSPIPDFGLHCYAVWEKLFVSNLPYKLQDGVGRVAGEPNSLDIKLLEQCPDLLLAPIDRN